MKLKNINLCGVNYKIDYKNKPSDVDIHGRETLFGQIDHFTQSIRILGTINEDMMTSVLFHEILHGIVDSQQIESLSGEENHADIDRLARLLYDTLNRNKMINK